MRVLITGASGQVGHALLRHTPQDFAVRGFSSAELDICDPAQVMTAVADYQPQLIINAAGYTAVDTAEAEPQRAWAVNCAAVGHLALAARQLGIPLFHLSTDYVFAGDAQTPYRESDPTAPASVYGASKLGGERELMQGCTRHIILRTSWVFGAHAQNFVKTMLRLGRERNELNVVADQYGCPTSAASIARALWTLAQQYHDRGTLQWGLYHYSGTPACSWYEFAQAIFSQACEQGLLAQPPRIHAIPTSAYPTPARRPAWSVLDCSKLHAIHGIAQADWREELRSVLQELD